MSEESDSWLSFAFRSSPFVVGGIDGCPRLCPFLNDLLKAHHHDAVYVSEYRSASALKSRFIEEGGRAKQPLSTAPTTTEPGFPGEDCLSRKQHLSQEKQHQKIVRFAVDGGVHTCPRSRAPAARYALPGRRTAPPMSCQILLALLAVLCF